MAVSMASTIIGIGGQPNISIHLTLGELASCCERVWFGVVGKRSKMGIDAQVISVVRAPEYGFA